MKAPVIQKNVSHSLRGRHRHQYRKDQSHPPGHSGASEVGDMVVRTEARRAFGNEVVIELVGAETTDQRVEPHTAI